MRLATDVVGDLRLNDETQLAEVFSLVGDGYRERVSLKDVARVVSLPLGHLITVVKRKTGRTVVEWISERRLVRARRLLVETDLALQEGVGRVAYKDPAYFARSFRRAHGTTPLGRWRAGVRK